MNYSTRPKL